MSLKKTVGVMMVLLFLAASVNVYAEKKKDKEKKGKEKQSTEQQSTEKQAGLSADEVARLASYKMLSDSIFIDELQPAVDNQTYFEIDPYTEAYEGMRVVRLLGLHTALPLKDQYAFVNALFGRIPKETLAVGAPIRNIVVPKWYKDGSPLIVHITKVFSGNKVPTVLALFNTKDGIRENGADVVKALPPGEDYPSVIKTDKGMSIRAKDYYSIKMLPNKIVTASGAVGKQLPGFDTISDVSEKVNVTDYYLRDGNPDNDSAVEPVLKAVIADEAVEPIIRLHANLQLFMFYLFTGDLVNAQQIADQIPASSLMKDADVAGSEIADVARNDLIPILNLAKSFKDGSAANL